MSSQQATGAQRRGRIYMGVFDRLKGKKVTAEFPVQQDDIQIKGLDNCLKSMCILDIVIQPKEKKWLRIINCYAENNSYMS